jgi:hypothetical protein
MRVHHTLTIGQRRLYRDHKFHPADPGQRLTSLHELRGALDLERLLRVCGEVYNSIGILKTTLVVENGAIPFLEYDATRSVAFETVHRAPDENLDAFRAGVIRDAQSLQSAPTDLSTWPSMKLAVYRALPDLHYVLQSAPHFFMDGLSFALLLKAVSDAYEGHGSFVGDLQSWEAAYLHPAAGALCTGSRCGMDYFLEELSGLQSLEVEAVRQPRDSASGIEGRVSWLQIPKQALHGLQALSQVSENVLFLALYSVLLQKLLGSALVIGYPVPNRSRRNHDSIGCFMNTLPVVVDYQPARTFAELVACLRKKTMSLYRRQDFDLDDIRGLATGMNCYFTFYPDEFTYTLSGCVCHKIRLKRNHVVSEARCTVERCSSVYEVEFDAGTCLKDIDLAGSFNYLLNAVSHNPDAPLETLGLAAGVEVSRCYSRLNSPWPLEVGGTLKAAFENVVERHRDRLCEHTSF